MSVFEDFVSVEDAADMLNIDRSRVTRLCRQGRFNGAVKVSRVWLIPRVTVLNHKPLPPGVKPKTPGRTDDAALLSSAIEAAKGNAYQNDTKRGQK